MNLAGRISLVVVLLCGLLGVSYVLSLRPYTVTAYRQFDNYTNGKRVRFVCSIVKKSGSTTRVEFDGQRIRLELDDSDQVDGLQPGAIVYATGRLRRSFLDPTLITLTNARIDPVEPRKVTLMRNTAINPTR